MLKYSEIQGVRRSVEEKTDYYNIIVFNILRFSGNIYELLF